MPAAPEQAEAARELAALRPEHTERAGTPLFFRQPEQRSATLRSQQILVTGMLRPAHLLDLIRANHQPRVPSASCGKRRQTWCSPCSRNIRIQSSGALGKRSR